MCNPEGTCLEYKLTGSHSDSREVNYSSNVRESSGYGIGEIAYARSDGTGLEYS